MAKKKHVPAVRTECDYVGDVDLRGLVSNLRELMLLVAGQFSGYFSTPEVQNAAYMALVRWMEHLAPYASKAEGPYRLEVFRERLAAEYRWNQDTANVEEGFRTCLKYLQPSALYMVIEAEARGWVLYFAPKPEDSKLLAK